MKRWVGAYVVAVALGGLSLTACSAGDSDMPPPRVVRQLPEDCREAMETTHRLLRRVPYYNNLARAAGQADHFPNRILAEARRLTHEVERLGREFDRSRDKCLAAFK